MLSGHVSLLVFKNINDYMCVISSRPRNGIKTGSTISGVIGLEAEDFNPRQGMLSRCSLSHVKTCQKQKYFVRNFEHVQNVAFLRTALDSSCNSLSIYASFMPVPYIYQKLQRFLSGRVICPLFGPLVLISSVWIYNIPMWRINIHPHVEDKYPPWGIFIPRCAF
jgi:hypothetical protein